MTFGLVDVGYSLPKGQAVKLIFFAPCCYNLDWTCSLIKYLDLIKKYYWWRNTPHYSHLINTAFSL